MKRILLLLFLACSLSAFAQSRYVRVTTLKGAVYEGKLKEFKPFQHVLVVVNGHDVSIPYMEMAYIDDLKTIKVEDVEPDSVVPESMAPKPSYKGFLLSTGNKVYLNCVTEPVNEAYTDAAFDVLRRQVRRDGFWTMVDNPADAHFAINYTLTLDGRGKTVLSISSNYVDNQEQLGSAGVPENVDDYRKMVYELYQKYILPLQKKIESERIPKHTKMLFTVE